MARPAQALVRAVVGVAGAAGGVALLEGCPMRRGAPPAKEPGATCPMRGGGAAAAPAAATCPMRGGGGGSLDPRNNMPEAAAQARAPGQTADLSTDRIESTIPTTAAEGGKWSYPSPQMFWNALVRKGKEGGASEADMDTVVAVHNSMNEATWLKVLEWEALRGGASPVKLSRFTGRPHDASPKAWLKGLCGHPAPFDRHDWVVDRGGAETRYVIDYYSDESRTGEDATPASLHDAKALASILIDVRPALDSPAALYQRCVAISVEINRWFGPD